MKCLIVVLALSGLCQAEPEADPAVLLSPAAPYASALPYNFGYRAAAPFAYAAGYPYAAAASSALYPYAAPSAFYPYAAPAFQPLNYALPYARPLTTHDCVTPGGCAIKAAGLAKREAEAEPEAEAEADPQYLAAASPYFNYSPYAHAYAAGAHFPFYAAPAVASHLAVAPAVVKAAPLAPAVVNPAPLAPAATYVSAAPVATTVVKAAAPAAVYHQAATIAAPLLKAAPAIVAPTVVKAAPAIVAPTVVKAAPAVYHQAPLAAAVIKAAPAPLAVAHSPLIRALRPAVRVPVVAQKVKKVTYTHLGAHPIQPTSVLEAESHVVGETLI